MTTSIPKRKGLLTIVGLAVGMLFLMACSTQPAPSTSGNVAPTNGQPTASQVSLSETSGPVPHTAALASFGEFQNTGIQVSGQGMASGKPDLATLNLGVEAFGSSVQEARDDAAAAMQEVLAVLRDEGIAEDDLQTSYFNISPRYSSREVTRCIDGPEDGDNTPDAKPEVMPGQNCFQDRESVITGYQVNNQLSVKVRDLDNLGHVIDAATGAAGNLIRFQGVYFSIEDTKELQAEARAAAMQDLQDRASQLAELGGVELGSLIYLNETGNQVPRTVTLERAAFDAAVPSSAPTQILSGELDVVVYVQGVYAIQ